MGYGPVSNANYASTAAGNWSSTANAWFVIIAFFGGIFLLFLIGGFGIHLDLGLGRG